MSFQVFYAIVVNGVEAKRRTRIRDARYHANLLRKEHGAYNVWLRPHFELVPIDQQFKPADDVLCRLRLSPRLMIAKSQPPIEEATGNQPDVSLTESGRWSRV